MKPVKAVRIGNKTVGGDGKLFVLAGPCVLEAVSYTHLTLPTICSV